MRSIIYIVLCLALGAGTGLGQAPAQAPPVESDFTIGAADLLEIGVLGVADFTRELRVTNQGKIRMPFLGDLEVEGLTCRELERKLASLLEPEYVRDPQVSVSIKEPRSRMFSLMGAVMKPGQYQILEQVTLVSALAAAGGLDFAKAGDRATIQRNHGVRPAAAVKAQATAAAPPAASYQIEVDLKKLLMAGDMSLDVPILPGDAINVPQRDKKAVYVIGDITRPGAFDYPPEGPITLSRAVALAGGPTKTSKLKETYLVRQSADGAVERISLNLGKILKGEHPDVELQPEDMLFVPGSAVKSLGWGLLGQVPNALTWGLVR